MFTSFNSRPYSSSRFSVCQQIFVEFRELRRYVQNNRGDIVFYDRFVFLCEQKGVAPSRAAIDAGISKSLVTKWKTNSVQVPSPDVLRKLAQYFNTTVAELMEEDMQKALVGNGGRDILDEVDISFYQGFKELTEDQQETIRDMVRLMRQRRAPSKE